MNREELFTQWKKMRYIGQHDNVAEFCSKQTINKLRKINDYNFSALLAYQNDYLPDVTSKDYNDKVNTYLKYRSSIVRFLTSDILSDRQLDHINQDVLDDYLDYKNYKARSTYYNNISYLKSFFQFLFENGYSINFDFDTYRSNAELIDSNPSNSNNAMVNLTPKQISEFYEICKDKPEYRYIVDMKYYTSFSDEEIKNLTLENVDIDNCTIIIDDCVETVPAKLINTIVELNSRGRLGKLNNITTYFNKRNLKPIFQQLGVSNIKSKDITKETKEKLSFRCPQCGNEYEAIVDNWCAVQYVENGQLWIVCARCGNV